MSNIVEINGKKIEVREPKVRDLRAVAHLTTQAEVEIHLLANLTGLTVDEIDDLLIPEYKKFQEVLKGFEV